MSRVSFEQLLETGAHFGHLTRKWNPAMAPYIFMERNDIHIIDLHKTVVKIDEAAEIIKNMARNGKRILFVATKKQAKESVAELAASVGMPYVVERWPGGMLTNFPTIRKAVKKMTLIDKMNSDGTFANLSKRERLQITRQREKLEKTLGSIADMNRLPSALFVVDATKEHIAVHEAHRLGIPVFGIIDTNTDPKLIDYLIPCNDDSQKAIELVISTMCQAISEGLMERKAEKPEEDDNNSGEEEVARRPRRERTGARRERIRRDSAEADEMESSNEKAAPATDEQSVVEKAPEATEKEKTEAAE